MLLVCSIEDSSLGREGEDGSTREGNYSCLHKVTHTKIGSDRPQDKGKDDGERHDYGWVPTGQAETQLLPNDSLESGVFFLTSTLFRLLPGY